MAATRRSSCASATKSTKTCHCGSPLASRLVRMQSSMHDGSGLFDTVLDLYRFSSGPLCAALFLGSSFVMLLIVGTIRLAPENLNAARPVMREMVEASRAELGCLHYSYAQDLLDPGLVHVKELWRDAAALDRHFAS